jgi:hypothetical protein
MERAHIPMTQESSHVEITDEGKPYHFLRYQGYCLILIHSTRPTNQPTELIMWRH